MKNSFLRKKTLSLISLAMMFLFVSCIDGYEDDKAWSSGVENASLESPAAEKISIVPSADGSKLKITWPVVPGAGGYEFSLYIVDDPENPVLVGEEKQVIDGCTAEREMVEDTYYEVIIKTLGNPKFNNKEAAQATEVAYNNMLDVTATIPNGTNLTEYFATNPIPESTTELCYELEPDGEYTMDGNVPVGLTSVTLRGNKVKHPKVTMTNGAFLNDGAGFKLKFIDLDCTNFDGTSVILLNPTFNPAAVLGQEGRYCIIPTTSPIAVLSCTIKGLKQRLFYDSNQYYGVGTLLIKDCVIEQNTTGSIQLIRSQRAVIKDLSLVNSTFYNKQSNGGYFIQLQGAKVTEVKPAEETWASANLLITNCTFWQVVKNDQMGNYSNNIAQKGNNITILNSIFVDCGNKAVVRRLGGGNANATLICGLNTYWYDGAFVSTELTTTPKDASGTHIETDPQLKDPENGDFTVGGSEQIAKRTGDPRWLPAE
ncbi:MAG: DUF4957 domain-containing protein [Mediterranea sp.]|jgi:hypothetical protein|nr:DUF4957 domain-containing protein [Mediterranea sp.]